jgi:hypothetical protein
LYNVASADKRKWAHPNRKKRERADKRERTMDNKHQIGIKRSLV